MTTNIAWARTQVNAVIGHPSSCRSTFDRMGRPEEIAALVGFLAGPSGDWITGQEIFPNGGWIMP